MRLERRGLLDARWQKPQRPGRPARHVYRLTGEGRRLAAETTAQTLRAAEVAV